MGLRIGPQPRHARGTPDRPYSALNLRLSLAILGCVLMVAIAVVAWRADLRAVAIVAIVFAVIAVVDLVIVQLRRSARARTEGDGEHTLFE